MSEYDAMLVLGARLSPQGQPTAVLRARLDEALRAYNEGLAPQVIVCGGTNKSGHNEADAMRAYLLTRGLPRGAVLRERQSVTTRGNLQLCRGLLLELGAKRLLAVTSGFHAPRVYYNAKQLGLNVTVRRARTPMSPDALHLLLREAAAFAVSLYRYPMRAGRYRPGRYHKNVELEGRDDNPMHPQATKGFLIEPVLVAPGVTRKTLAHSPELMVCEVHLQNGARVEEHAHAHQQITYVVQGSVIAHTRQGDVNLNAGDSIHFPPHAPHAVTATSADTVVTDSLTPCREDFL